MQNWRVNRVRMKKLNRNNQNSKIIINFFNKINKNNKQIQKNFKKFGIQTKKILMKRLDKIRITFQEINKKKIRKNMNKSLMLMELISLQMLLMEKKFKEYCRKRLQKVQKDNPLLRHSQIMEMIYKQWKTDPLNPKNQ
ncbi:unnamed protein product [Paramecium octaurelia]|uniref:Coiled-coil domain-containing protein n=1 Tax=Paramecium octaurelia TaxID=43137 RepID=A0A8S1VLH0_PAROT|nr:unnamed protein product [Paramecium octaurelia]